MLAVRIIPTLLARGSTLVKGTQFNGWRTVGHVQQAAMIHAKRGVDELIVLDIAATPAGKGPNFQLAEDITKQAFTPVTFGGGIKTVADAEHIMRAGADKVCIGTAAYGGQLVKDCAKRFGSQAISVAIDTMFNLPRLHCGTKAILVEISEYARTLENAGAGEIVLTSIEREGTMEGYDLDLIRRVAKAVGIPVIAHGGCGTPEHAYQAIQAGANAVAIGAMFQFTDETPKTVAQYLNQKGIEVRT